MLALTLVLALSITPSVFAAEEPAWDISRSKVATALNENNESTVTLSLPSAEENLNSEVVFVLDGSSSANTAVVKDSLDLLQALKTATENSGAAVNVCVVKFKRQAFKSDWYDLSNNFDAIKSAMETKYSGGTNIHAGLLAGKAALDEHDDVSADRKYLILISDGSTYLYSKDGKWDSDTPFTRSYYPKESYNGAAGGYWDNGYYEPNNYPEVNVPRPKTTSDVDAWHKYLNDVKARNETVNSEGKTGDDYDYYCNYDLNFNQGKPSPDFKSQPCEKRTANNRDMAFYYADQAWQEMKNAGYHLFSIATEDGSAGAGNADDSHCFMNYLNGGASLDFDAIKKEIIYVVGAGSQVEDKMGSDFDLVPGTFQLTVGGKALTCIRNGNTYSFGDDVKSDRFVIIYNEGDDSFTWTINENVSNFAPVQLSYKVKLTNPSTTAGTYEVPTNEYARLTPKDSTGVVGQTVEFDIPKVNYTVSEQSLSYDANGGIGTMSAETDVAGKIVTVAQNEFTRNNYTFTGWNTQADGKGTAYQPGDKFTLTAENTVLYAQWSKNAPAQVNVSYDANGGVGTMESVTGDVGSEIVIQQSGFTRSEYTFTGWNTQADGKGTAYKAGDSFTLTDKDTVLYAQWSKNAPAQVKVSYNANGGVGTMESVTGDVGSKIVIRQSGFTRSEYTFTGWNTQADGKGTAYKAGDSFTLTDKDTVLYAQWSKNSGSAGTGTNGTAKPTDIPKTGDNSNLTLWFALLIVSGGAVIATAVISSKKKRSEK